MCVCVRVSWPVFWRVCVCLCVSVCGCACVAASMVVLRLTVRVCVGAVVARRGRAVLIARPAAPACACALLRFGAIGRVDARLAAGVTWTSRTTSAPWAARYAHTSVIDAAGTIYVIGGRGGVGIYYNDVWASMDGGVRPDSVGGGWSWGTPRGYYRGTQGYDRVLGGSKGFLGDTRGYTHTQKHTHAHA